MRSISMNRNRCKTWRKGLGLVEAMIALAITAALLTAVGTAFTSSAQAIKMNDDFFRASQAARVSMEKILSQIRRGAVDEASTSSNLHIITDAGQDISYIPDLANNQILMRTNAITTDPDFVMARNVTACTIDIRAGTDYNNAPCVARVNIEIAVKVGNNEVRLSGAAVPRINMKYY